MNDSRPLARERDCALGAPWSLDLRSWHFSCSDQARQLCGLPPGPLTLWQVLSSVEPQDLPRLLASATTALRTGIGFDLELATSNANGGRRVVVKASVLHDAARRPRLIEGSVQPFAAPIAPAQTDATHSHLREALFEWELFARSIPHELKGPLYLANAFADALNEREGARLSQTGQRFVENIRRSTAQARSLCEGLLVLAPLSLQAMRRETVDLSAVAREVLECLRASQPERVVEVMIQPGLVVTGDPDMLRTLVSNLLGNAWKFSAPSAQARIAFEMTPSGSGGPAFCVSDNGVGFDMEHAAKLFTALSRLHPHSAFPGSGLGLAISRRIVERHGGRIWAHSAEGKGARVYFSLDPAATAGSRCGPSD